LSSVQEALIGAQRKAEELFAEVVAGGLIRSGVLESELSDEIHVIAERHFGVRRHWHRRIVRSGPSTLLGYYAEPPDRRLGEDETVFLDFGPVFDSWEADFGRTYVLGNDARKHKLVSDMEAAFRKGKALYADTPDLTAGSLYDFVCKLATEAGWEFGAPAAGHLIGHFPHVRPRSRSAFRFATATSCGSANRMPAALPGTGFWRSISSIDSGNSAASSRSC
jgi:Xaa-Pro aminopeptidase